MYYIVFLTPGQKPPSCTTGKAISNGGIVCVCNEGEFPISATLGNILPTDSTPSSTYDYRAMTDEEINEYENPPTE